MTKAQRRKGLITTIVVLGLTLLVVGGILIWQSQSQNTAPAAEGSSETTQPADEEVMTADDVPAEVPSDPEISTVDPSTLDSIDIEPLGISVLYTKGTGGFEFEVLRASDGTRYVEFSNSALVGTKCSDDNGVFATIIESPASPEDSSLISQTVVVDGSTYGLSLATDTCTANADLLKDYQSGFINGFSQLKKIESE